MKRRELIVRAAAMAGVATVDKAWAQPVAPMTVLPPVDAAAAKTGFIQASIVEIFAAPSKVDGKVDGTNTTPVVILKARDEERYLPIYIGLTESLSISMGLENTPPSRPMSHDLMVGLIQALQGHVAAVYVQHGPQKDVFYGSIKVIGKGIETEVDSRASDALALALRVKAPILVAVNLMQQTTLDEIKQQ